MAGTLRAAIIAAATEGASARGPDLPQAAFERAGGLMKIDDLKRLVTRLVGECATAPGACRTRTAGSAPRAEISRAGRRAAETIRCVRELTA